MIVPTHTRYTPDNQTNPSNSNIQEFCLEERINLTPLNTFGIRAQARYLARIRSDADVRRALDLPTLGAGAKWVLGGGSNIILTQNTPALVLKSEVAGKRLIDETATHWLVESGAGENWHDFVAWTLEQGFTGLENMALIPGTVGAAPVQNIGAYGVELQDHFHSLDAVDLVTGRSVSLDAMACRFGYRDSVFKQDLRSKSMITRVRFALPKKWKPVLGYTDLERMMAQTGVETPTAQQVFDWVCEIRQSKLPDPRLIGNAGSFFKNPTVTPEQCQDIIGRDPHVVHYALDDGHFKLAAGWLIDACGWKGKSIGGAAVYEKQALVLINKGGASGAEVMTLAAAIQTSVYERFGIKLEPEPVVI